ncbi:MAG: hypothetical protein A2007_02045, partial [Verrucomicrobia bacterium GWC2_42_7]
PTKPSVAAPVLPPKPATLAPTPGVAQRPPLTADEIQMQKWKTLADRGDIEAAYQLGVKYRTGYNSQIADIKGEVIHFNKELGIHYLYQAASRGHYSAIISLIAALEGPTNLDLRGIVKILNTKMMQGDVEAKRSLGKIYMDGIGVNKDETKAFQYINEAAAVGDIGAISLMSTIYFKGLCGQGKNLDLAEQYALQVDHFEGDKDLWGPTRLAAIAGQRQDSARFLKYTERAAKLGDTPSQCIMGQLYIKGNGVPQNRETAIYWFSLAASNGNAYSIEQLASILERPLLH